MNKRQKKLLEVTTEILDIIREYDYINLVNFKDANTIRYLLKYDAVDQDLGCLVDDLKIEFDLDN